MTTINRISDSQSFDRVAELYDRYRPSYPAELIEAIVQLSGVQQDERILEIGSGTGQAAILFAERGLRILCLEPGQNLIAITKENLKPYPNVSFARAQFEEWDADQGKFDLVVSAQAFHWVPEEVRYKKTADVLKKDGCLAIFWNMYPGIEGDLGVELDILYRQRAPELVKPTRPFDALIERRADSLCKSAYFAKVVVKKYL